MKPFIVIGNWKMNGTVGETLKRITELSHKLGTPKEPLREAVEIVLAPPHTALYTAAVVMQDTTLKLAGQNMHWDNEGPYTGEVSGLFLKDVGCSHVLIGHSERRQHFGETDESVNRKIRSAISNELISVLCIGETIEQRQEGRTEAVLEGQLKKALTGFMLNDLKDLIIAYEPVWAIGTGKTPSASEIGEIHHYLRNLLAKNYDAPLANSIPLLYGGSVGPDNASQFAKAREVDGLLVGGASLDVDKFLKIIKARDSS